jgi:DNA-binding response OmpR family regulator
LEKIVILDDDADIRRIAELPSHIEAFDILTAEDGRRDSHLSGPKSPGTTV